MERPLPAGLTKPGPDSLRITAIIPTYDNPQTIRAVVERVRAHLDDVIVVDDGSAGEGRAACEALAREGLARVVHRDRNGGKGAAVKTGLEEASRLGFTHALQVDADGQHALEDIPRFLDIARHAPDALVLGEPQFDGTAPKARSIGRRITTFWVWVECGGSVIGDAMCGFRVYPIGPAIAARARGDAMDFDPEIAVRMVWAHVPVINVPTRVRYLSEDEGGVSHFRVFKDNVWISWLHARLTFARVMSLIFGPLFRKPLPG